MDADQILQDVYDPTNHAFRVTYGGPNKPVYSPALHALNIDDPVAGSGTYGTKLGLDQIIKKSFNGTTGKLRIVGTT
jgi:hypothetical protein